MCFSKEIEIDSDRIKKKFREILKNGGIFCFACYICDTAQDVADYLSINKTDLLSRVRKKCNVTLFSLLSYIKSIDFLRLNPSMGMIIALNVYNDNNFRINDEYLEIIDPLNSYSFELKFIKKHSDELSFLSKCSTEYTFPSMHPKHFDRNEFYIRITFETAKNYSFYRFVQRYHSNYPECFSQIPFLEQVSCNRNLAIVFLCGNTYIDNPGIDSFHLSGTMTPSLRLYNTGYLLTKSFHRFAIS